MAATKHFFEAAIDPAALVLHGKWLDIYYQIHHPNEPPSATISKVLREAPAAEREVVLARAGQLAAFAAEAQKAAGAGA